MSVDSVCTARKLRFGSLMREMSSCVADKSGSIRLRVILDRNSVEVFVGEGEKTLTMTLVTPVTADGISFSAEGGAAMDVTLHELAHE